MNWYRSESAVMPLEIDTESSNTYNYVRRNVEEVEREENGETIKMYTYEESKVLKADWGLYLDLTQAQADIDYLNMITEDL